MKKMSKISHTFAHMERGCQTLVWNFDGFPKPKCKVYICLQSVCDLNFVVIFYYWKTFYVNPISIEI